MPHITQHFSLRRLGLVTGALSAVLLAGCGGGGSDTPPALDNAPGGALFGFYAESPEVNDPDPAIGGVYLDVPDSEGSIKGRMSFRYFDCEAFASNSIEIKGKKLTRYINGTAEGDLDSQSSNELTNRIFVNLSADYSRANNAYRGNYDLGSRGNDERTLANCNNQKFVLARKGALTLYPANTVFPENFEIKQLNRIISWSNPPAAARKVLLDVIDPQAIGTSSANGMVYQTVGNDLRLFSLTVPADAVISNKEYIVVVQLFDNANQPVAFKQIRTSF